MSVKQKKLKVDRPLEGDIDPLYSLTLRIKTNPASQCAYYPPYLPKIVLKITNIT